MLIILCSINVKTQNTQLEEEIIKPDSGYTKDNQSKKN